MKAIHRYEVPIDDQWHQIEMTTGRVVHVASRRAEVVEFWAEAWEEATYSRWFRVYGTGHEVPDNAQFQGTAFSPAIIREPFSTPAGRLVRHLFERIS